MNPNELLAQARMLVTDDDVKAVRDFLAAYEEGMRGTDTTLDYMLASIQRLPDDTLVTLIGSRRLAPEGGPKT